MPTRLSFMNVMLRRALKEKWQFCQTEFSINENSEGHAVYTVTTRHHTYSLVCFSHKIDDSIRSDRVIANAWDATFSLIDGTPSEDDVQRLSSNTPFQEKGRFSSRELVLSRANKSSRIFSAVVDALAQGRQPSTDLLKKAGYLVRTTAVYGNGKFGCSDRFRIQHRPDLKPPFQVEMIAVYLIRLFSLDLVEHLAHVKNPERSVKLSEHTRSQIGVGNATGLGMAPFMINHAPLIHQWVCAKERALAIARSSSDFSKLKQLPHDLHRASLHIQQWLTEDDIERKRINNTQKDLQLIISKFNTITKDQLLPYNELYLFAEKYTCIGMQELIVSLLIQLFPDDVDDLSDEMAILNSKSSSLSPEDARKPIRHLNAIIKLRYDWTFSCFSPDKSEDIYHFWYYADDKIEPRFGTRFQDDGCEKEMPIAVARDVRLLWKDSSRENDSTSLRSFLLAHPEHRHTVERIFTLLDYPYAEIRENVIKKGVRPVDLLRFKLAFFGAYSFDPKSDLWLRINMFQGAPLPDTLSEQSVNDWHFPVL